MRCEFRKNKWSRTKVNGFEQYSKSRIHWKPDCAGESPPTDHQGCTSRSDGSQKPQAGKDLSAHPVQPPMSCLHPLGQALRWKHSCSLPSKKEDWLCSEKPEQRRAKIRHGHCVPHVHALRPNETGLCLRHYLFIIPPLVSCLSSFESSGPKARSIPKSFSEDASHIVNSEQVPDRDSKYHVGKMNSISNSFPKWPLTRGDV